jgi:AraC-like DNA-binding protein
MESSYLLKLSAAQQELLAQRPFISKELLAAAIEEHAEQIGYMLQAYFPREKIRKVKVVPGSIVVRDVSPVSLRLEFVKEEFSMCSAIDSELKDSMAVTVIIDKTSGVLKLQGESWPEL